MLRRILNKAFKRQSVEAHESGGSENEIVCGYVYAFVFWKLTSFVSRRGMWRKRWASRRNPRRRC